MQPANAHLPAPQVIWHLSVSYYPRSLTGTSIVMAISAMVELFFGSSVFMNSTMEVDGRGTTRQNDDVTTSDEMERNNATIKQTKRTWQDARGGATQQRG